MLAEIVTIGDELCRGEIVDTNSSWLAEALWESGVTVAWMTSCRDVASDIRDAFSTAASRAGLVLCSGGLGPTEDDLTADVLSELVKRPLAVDEPSLARMKARFEAASFRLTENNLRQVRVPEGATVFENPVGLAPAFEVSLEGTPVICMPGVPRELKALFGESISSRVEAALESEGASRDVAASRTYRIFGIGESHISRQLEGLLDDYPSASIHYRPSFPEVALKIVIRAVDRTAAAAGLDELDEVVRSRLGDRIYGVGDDTLAAALGRDLIRVNRTLAVAESCTGGLVGATLTAMPGSSAFFIGGSITYSDGEKVRQLGVSPETLEGHGAVSEETALEMAAGIRERSGADYGISLTGIAGPDGGSAEKPVGTVWIAVSSAGGTNAFSRRWPGARDQVRTIAAHWAMARLRKVIAADGVGARDE